jgi:hypothetical protein
VSSVPTTFTVTPPKSLRSGVGSISASQLEDEFAIEDDFEFDDEDGDSSDSMAYEQLRETISQVEDSAAYTSMNFVAIESVISGLERQSEAYEARTVTITQAMADVIEGVLSDAFGEGAEDVDILGAMVGEEITVGSFRYRDPEGEKYDYAFEGSLTFWDGYESTLSYFWSEEKSQVRAVETISDEEFGDFTITYTYDGDENKSTVKYEMSGDFSLESTITMREKADDPNNGVFVSFDGRGSDAGMSFAYRANGFADDNGGYLESEIESGGESFSYKEGFDADGNNTYLAMKNEEGDWEDPSVNDGFDDTDYATEFEEYDYDGDVFDIVLDGATEDSFYLVSDDNLGTSFQSGSDFEALAIGDAIGLDTDEVSVLLWKDPAEESGNTFYFYEERETADGYEYTLVATILEDDLEFVDVAEGEEAATGDDTSASGEESLEDGEIVDDETVIVEEGTFDDGATAGSEEEASAPPEEDIDEELLAFETF